MTGVQTCALPIYPDDIETLEDLIISAVNEALRAQEDDYNSSMGKISGGMGLGGLPF